VSARRAVGCAASENNPAAAVALRLLRGAHAVPTLEWAIPMLTPRVFRAAAVLVIAAWSLAAGDATRHADEVTGGRLVDAGHHAEGLQLLARVLVVYRRSGDRVGASRVAVKMSAASRALGRLDEAARQAQEAQAFAGTDPVLRLAALTQVGRVAAERGDLGAADAALREAAGLAERRGDALAEATALRALARVSDARGQRAEDFRVVVGKCSAAFVGRFADADDRAIEAAERHGEQSLRAVAGL